MKLSRNVLVGSLATAGMVLGAVAPALTAQAATTTGSVNSKGEVERVDKTDIGALPGNDKLAIAYNTDPAGEKPDGEATATSNAAVNVISGILVLNAVPDFNFGSAVSGQTKDLVDNTKDPSTMSAENKAANVDGNDQGKLSVSESRDVGDKKAQGFTLSAALGAFTDKEGNVAGEAASSANPFILNLASVPVTDGQNTISNGTKGDLTTDAQPLTSSTDKTTVGKSATILDLTNGDAAYKQGEYVAEFTPAVTSGADKKAAGATLGIPDLGETGDSAKVQSLNASIVWTLAAKANTTPAP